MGDLSRLSDEALLAHVRKLGADGRPQEARDAFGRLFFRYEGALRSRAVGKLPADDVEDAVQLIGLKFLVKAQSDVEIENVKAYIHGIARNVIADQAAAVKEQRKRSASLPSEHVGDDESFEDALGEFDAGYERVDERLAADGAGPIIQSVRAKLNPLHARVIDLCEIGNCSPDEAVDQIRADGGEMTRDNVYQIRRRFHVQLKKALTAAGFGEDAAS